VADSETVNYLHLKMKISHFGKVSRNNITSCWQEKK
jgi:hypothetical protein